MTDPTPNPTNDPWLAELNRVKGGVTKPKDALS